MALRRDQHQDKDKASLADERGQPGQIVEHPAGQDGPIVRSEVVAIDQAIIKEDRPLLERLTAYDQGAPPETAGAAKDKGTPADEPEYSSSPAPQSVRPEMLAIGHEVINTRRKLLERLAAYDREGDSGR